MPPPPPPPTSEGGGREEWEGRGGGGDCGGRAKIYIWIGSTQKYGEKNVLKTVRDKGVLTIGECLL